MKLSEIVITIKKKALPTRFKWEFHKQLSKQSKLAVKQQTKHFFYAAEELELYQYHNPIT